MSTPKGWPGQRKEIRGSQEFATVSPSGKYKHGLDIKDKSTVFSVGTDAVEALSTAIVINATAHAAKKGDTIRFTSGVHSGTEVEVLSVTTNAITLAFDLDAAPTTLDAFTILRPVSLTIGSDGSITTTSTQGPLIFTRNGADQEVTEDTGTPANNRPLPVLITGASGTVNITAGNLEVALDSASDSVSAVVTSSVLPTGAATSVLQTSGNASLTSIDGKLNSLGQKVSAASLPVVIASDQSAVPVSGTISVTGVATEATLANIDGNIVACDTGNVTVASSALPTGAATEATLLSIDTSLSSPLAVTGTFFQATQPISAAALPLPSGAATETTLASIDGKITAVNTGAVTISSALPAGSNNIGDVDVLSLPSIPSGTNNIGDVDVLSLPGSLTGVAEDTAHVSGDVGLQLLAVRNDSDAALTDNDLDYSPISVDINGHVKATVNGTVSVVEQAIVVDNGTYGGDFKIVGGADGGTPYALNVDLNGYLAVNEKLDVKDFIDTTPVLDSSSTNIPASASSPVEIVSSLASIIKKIRVNDTTGEFIGLYTGAAASEVLQCVIGPGMDGEIPVMMDGTSRVSLRNMANSTISTGKICIQFLS